MTDKKSIAAIVNQVKNPRNDNGAGLDVAEDKKKLPARTSRKKKTVKDDVKKVTDKLDKVDSEIAIQVIAVDTIPEEKIKEAQAKQASCIDVEMQKSMARQDSIATRGLKYPFCQKCDAYTDPMNPTEARLFCSKCGSKMIMKVLK